MPLHKLVQAAHIAHQLVARTQIEMIGIAQHERRIDILEMFGSKGFYSSLGANGGENRCKKIAVRRGKYPCASTAVAGGDGEIKHIGDYNGRD